MGSVTGNPVWQNRPAEVTPISAEALEAIESGLDAHEALLDDQSSTLSTFGIYLGALGSASSSLATRATALEGLTTTLQGVTTDHGARLDALEAAPPPSGGGGGGTSHGVVCSTSAEFLSALGAGHKLIKLNPGTYNISSTVFIPRGVRIEGAGQSTRLICTKSGSPLPYFIRIEGDGSDGIQIMNLVIDVGSGTNSTADVAVCIQPMGNAGNYRGEPDAVFRFWNLWVYGGNYAGWQTLTNIGQNPNGTSYSRSSYYGLIRVRNAGLRAFDIWSADSWFDHCEGTTNSIDAQGAGFYMGGANNFISGCKMWYCRNYGFWNRGGRNTYTNNHSQDTRNHGWFIDWDKSVYVGNIADCAAFSGVNGTLNGADGWYVNAGDHTIVGNHSFDRAQNPYPRQQRHGFNIPSSVLTPSSEGNQVRFSGNWGWGNNQKLIHVR